MDESDTHGAEFCSDLVRTQDEDRWLCTSYASDEDARKLRALYALHCELRHIPAAVSEPPLGEIRLQWWREALAEIREGKKPRGHPVVEELAACGIADEIYKDLLSVAIDAGARPLYGEGFSDIDDLVQWLSKADGSFDAIAVRLLGGDASLAEAAASGGGGFALAREGRRLAPHLATDVRQNAGLIWEETRAILRHSAPTVWPAFLPFCLTRSYIQNDGEPFPVMKRLRLFSAFAFRML